MLQSGSSCQFCGKPMARVSIIGYSARRASRCSSISLLGDTMSMNHLIIHMLMHVEAFLYLLTRWAIALSWKQQIQNGTNFEQGKIYGSRHSAKRKNYDRDKKRFLRLFMKIFWAILADCYPKSTFLMKVPPPSAIKSETVDKEKEGWESALLEAST